MHVLQLTAVVISLVVTVVGIVSVARTAAYTVRVVRIGQPDPTRGDAKGRRLATAVRETLGHTRMLRWNLVGTAHWFVFVGFWFLVSTLVTAYGQVFSPPHRSRCR